LAPHLSSLTHPLTVALFPISSNAIAVSAKTKQIARHSTKTFLMAGFSPFCRGPKPLGMAGDSNRAPGSTSTLHRLVDRQNYTI
jgi:hypothetical protein